MDADAVAELIAMGASAAANCDTCLRYHSKQAKKLGVSADDMASAVRIGLMVKQVPHQRLLAMAERQGLQVAEDEEAGGCCAPTSGCCAGDEEDGGSRCCGWNRRGPAQHKPTKETPGMDKQNEAKPKKRSLWALLKESMDKASSGCGPGCGCHVEKQGDGKQQKGGPGDSGDGKEQA